MGVSEESSPLDVASVRFSWIHSCDHVITLSYDHAITLTYEIAGPTGNKATREDLSGKAIDLLGLKDKAIGAFC